MRRPTGALKQELNVPPTIQNLHMVLLHSLIHWDGGVSSNGFQRNIRRLGREQMAMYSRGSFKSLNTDLQLPKTDQLKMVWLLTGDWMLRSKLHRMVFVYQNVYRKCIESEETAQHIIFDRYVRNGLYPWALCGLEDR